MKVKFSDLHVFQIFKKNKETKTLIRRPKFYDINQKQRRGSFLEAKNIQGQVLVAFLNMIERVSEALNLS